MWNCLSVVYFHPHLCLYTHREAIWCIHKERNISLICTLHLATVLFVPLPHGVFRINRAQRAAKEAKDSQILPALVSPLCSGVLVLLHAWLVTICRRNPEWM